MIPDVICIKTEQSEKTTWINLLENPTQEQFLAACRKAFPDEEDPKIIFIDWPERIEGMLDLRKNEARPSLWAYLAMSEQDRMAIFAASSLGLRVSDTYPVEAILMDLVGVSDSIEEWATERLVSSGQISSEKAEILKFIDWNSYMDFLEETDGIEFAAAESKYYFFVVSD